MGRRFPDRFPRKKEGKRELLDETHEYNRAISRF